MPMCQFCNRGDLEHQIVKETNGFIVIQARRPLSKGHIMIIPKEHTNSFNFTQNQSTEIFELINTFSNIFHSQLYATGVNVFSNIGASAGQTIPHLHFHIVARFDSEEESPFAILNDREKYKALKQLTKEEIEEQVQSLG